jgi:hypothetical protein
MREAIRGHPSQSAAIRGISGGARGSLVRTAAPRSMANIGHQEPSEARTAAPQSMVNIGHQEPSEARTAARLAQGRPWMLGDGAAPWRV